MRSLALTRALAARFDVTLVVGGRVPKMAAADRQRIVALPPVGLDRIGALASRDRRRRLDRAQDLRRRILLDTFHKIRPQAVVVELFPFGRHKVTSELEPMLAEARAAGPDQSCAAACATFSSAVAPSRAITMPAPSGC
jgi:predicted glycosyltransferase